MTCIYPSNMKTELVAVFIETSLGTHFAVSIHPDATVGQLISKLEVEHYSCFHEFGRIKITSLQVKRGCRMYHLSHSHPIRLFVESCNAWFVHAAAFQISSTREPSNKPEKKEQEKPSHVATEKKEQEKTCHVVTEKKELQKPSHVPTEKKEQGKPIHVATEKKEQEKPSHAATTRREQEKPSNVATEKKEQEKPSHVATERREQEKPSHVATEKKEQEKTLNCKFRSFGLGNRVVRAAERLNPCPKRLKLSKLVLTSETRYATLMANAYSFK